MTPLPGGPDPLATVRSSLMLLDGRDLEDSESHEAWLNGLSALEQLEQVVKAAKAWDQTYPPGIGAEELPAFLDMTPQQRALELKGHMESESALRRALQPFESTSEETNRPSQREGTS